MESSWFVVVMLGMVALLCIGLVVRDICREGRERSR
jgi:hypothetical protein